MNQKIDMPEEETLESEDDFARQILARNRPSGSETCCLAILCRGFSG